MRSFCCLIALWLISLTVSAQGSYERNSIGNEKSRELYSIDGNDKITMTVKGASFIAQWNLKNFRKEYPSNRIVVYMSKDDVQSPSESNPAFIGYDDWHSAVHSHWTMVKLLKKYPDLPEAKELKKCLETTMDEKLIAKELEFFKKPYNASFEFPYGQSWLLKLATELYTWNDPLGVKLYERMRPLVDLVSLYYYSFVLQQPMPDRYGHHQNTAFGMINALDYAKTFHIDVLEKYVDSIAGKFYFEDINAPLKYEPSSGDFLSPNYLEAALMSKVLNQDDFLKWLSRFMPGFLEGTLTDVFSEATVDYSSHLRGYNLTKAFCLNTILKKIPPTYPGYKKAKAMANMLVTNTLPSFGEDSEEDSHWIGTFIMLAMDSSD